MTKRGISGGMLSISSLIEKSERSALGNNSMIKTSSTIREAAKIGLQSLYANADEVLEKYKDFDIIKEMKARNGANLLWVRARAIDADVVNTNGDYFSKAELIKEVDYQGNKMPAYKTFEGVPIYTNHKNDNIEDAKGMVVYAEWDDDENCVYCVFFIDEDAYPDIARGVRQGYIHDVSMGCFPKGTPVLTQSGYKPIENVEQNDLLVDADGKLTKIINRQIKLETEKIYNITIEGGIVLDCTKEHPILSVTKKDWQKRVKRNKNNTPQREYNNVIPTFIEAQELNKGDMIAVHVGGEVVDSDLTVDQAKLLGLFAAEGNYLKYKNEIKEIEFTFALDEKYTLVKECVDLLYKVFNVEARQYERIPKSTIAVRVYSPEIAEWFKYNIGEYSNGKNISKELRFARLDIQKAFVCNWIKGDGCITHKSLPSNGICGTTTSLALAQDITYILTRLGIYHKVYARYEQKTLMFGDALKIFSNSKGFDGRQMSFDIEIPSYEASLIANDCGFVCNHYRKLNKNYTDGYIMRKIQNITSKEYFGTVYNFETESHTYTVQNVGVHNCSVDLGICSICGNHATTEKDYCDCLKKYKGKMHPSGKKAYEDNFGIKFIELSCVGDGAFESCEILELYDQEEILEKAKGAIKAAQSLNSSISLAASMNSDILQKREIETALRQLQNLNRDIIRVAQTAGTLVGGQLMSGGTGAQNATVVKVLQGLGIDPSSSLNILDLVNLALNFLEVAVLNLFSRKDNIDLGHVAKLTKAMGELQNTLQDMIDDGIETAGQKNGQPMAPASPQGAQQAPPMPAAPTPGVNAAPAMPTQQALFQPQVGTMVSQQPQFVMPLGGGVAASADNTRFVWASKGDGEEVAIPQTQSTPLNKFGTFAVALNNLREACGIAEIQKSEEFLNIPQKDKTLASSGDKNIMDHFKKIAQDLKKQTTVALAIDIKLDDQSGNRIVLSTDKGIKGYHKGQLTNWKPVLSDVQLSQMENNDGMKVASELLKDFSSLVKTAEKENTVDCLIVEEEALEEDREYNNQQIIHEINNSPERANGMTTMQEKLEMRRDNKVIDIVREESLEPLRTHELVRIVTELKKDATKGLGMEPLEEMLHPNFGKGPSNGKEIMCNVLNGVIKTCQSTNEKPEKVLGFLTANASSTEFGKILKLARLGSDARAYENLMNKFAQSDIPMDDKPDMGMSDGLEAPSEEEPESAMDQPPMEETSIKDIADTATPETTEGEIISALNVIKDNFSTAVEKITELLSKDQPGGDPSKEDDMKDALSDDSDALDKDTMKGAVSGLSLSGEDTGASPNDIVGAVNGMPTDDMASSIDKARLPFSATARAKDRNTRTASVKDLNNNIIGWLADVANDNNIPTEKIVLAAKLFCSYKEAATDVLSKSIRKSEIKVVDETTHSTTIYATLDDIGVDVKDASFNEKFRDFAVNLLSTSGYEVDPTTFSLTDIEVHEDGMVCGKVTTRATKTFNPEVETQSPIMDNEYIDPDRASKAAEFPAVSVEGEIDTPNENPEELNSVVMSEAVKSMNRLARLQNIIKVAQGLGLPGAPSGGAGGGQGAGAAPVDPLTAGAGMAGGANDLGVGSLTGSSPDMGGEPGIDESPEPGNAAPWGTICPQCGSKDVDIANGEGQCNGCHANLKYKFIVEVAPPDDGAKTSDEGMPPAPEEPPAPPVGGMGGPEAGLGEAPGATPPAPGGMPAMASTKVMKRIAYKTSADVYANALSENFNKDIALKLPVGLICPACSSRTASKNSKHTYCYDCGTMSVSVVKRIDGEPGQLEANIFWI